jgi:hypothetical protein
MGPKEETLLTFSTDLLKLSNIQERIKAVVKFLNMGSMFYSRNKTQLGRLRSRQHQQREVMEP